MDGPERILALGFEDVIALPALDAPADAVSITVGRVDWTAFPWAEHNDAWSPWVVDTGRDFVAEAIATLSAGRRVALIVDVMVERWIARDPSIAGVDARGERSTEFASITALGGPVGDRIVELVAAAADYGCDVTLTEGFLDRWTFGADDLNAYRRWGGASAWPVLGSGGIDEGHPSIGAWRSAALTELVRRCAEAAHARGVELHVEVRAQWDGPTNRDGQDYAALLRVADRLVIWGYFALSGRGPESLERLAREAPAGSTISIGLWGPVSPPDLRRAVTAAARGGARSVAVVPMSLMTPAHWDALRGA